MQKLIILLAVFAGVAALELVPVHSAYAFFGEHYGRGFRGGEGRGYWGGPIIQYPRRSFGEGWRGYGFRASPYYGGNYYVNPGFNYGYNSGYGFGGNRGFGYYPSYNYGWGNGWGGYCE